MTGILQSGLSVFFLFVLAFLSMSAPACASQAGGAVSFDPLIGYAVLMVFAAAYLLVFFEERLHLRKSKPVLVASGLIWIIVGVVYAEAGRKHEAAALLRHNVLEFAELLLFLLSAMTFINTMVERNVFDVIRSKLIAARLSFRSLFWVTGALAFFISPIADNLTTALVMGTVVIAIAKNNKAFVSAACVNIVVAANAGGAFSPFGDITTLMVWQKGMVAFGEFFRLFVPSLVNWIVPAAAISLTIPKSKPAPETGESRLKKGGLAVVFLFLLTIGLTVTMHHTLELPPFLGMMSGLGLLKAFGYFLRRKEKRAQKKQARESTDVMTSNAGMTPKAFDIFDSIRDVEWDTLLFFYGVILCIGGLSAMGYLDLLSGYLYNGMGPTVANVSIGALSAIVDNIPLTYAVLTMKPDMSLTQWLLLTLSVGVGGSLLSIGSAAGVALMGLGRGSYTFFSHLKWSWAILFGYAASILTLMLISGRF